MQTSESNILNRARNNMDWLLGTALFVFTFLVYLRTLAPTVAYLFDDSLEFQLLASRMAIAHPTGYPLYSLLIKLATFLPFGDVAYRVNLVSALSAAGAVMLVYLAARLLTTRFINANNVVGEILARAPALIASLALAFGEIFWSQAVIAEVYALQAFLTAAMLWLVLRWGTGDRGQGAVARIPLLAPPSLSLIPIAFFAGLMLTHHRMSVLLLPALVAYVLSYDRVFLKQPALLLKIGLAFILPLLLYLYLPIRGMVTSSLDGAYQNTLDGFLNWILGTAYTVFVTQNPFHQTRDAAYYFELFVNELSAWGLLAAVGGFVALFLRAWREWVLLTLALIANLAFVLTYRVADIHVFFIPTFVILALFAAAGLAGLLWLAYYALPQHVATIAACVGAVVLLAMPIALFRANYVRVNLSNKYDVIEYGRDLLLLELPKNATIIGILGEMSLLRYLQETQHFRSDIETIAADKEENRFNAIDDALGRDRVVFLTRPLNGVEKQYALTSVGALIQVQPKPNKKDAPSPPRKLRADFGNAMLLGYDANLHAPRAKSGQLNPQHFVRATLYWQAQEKISDARLVSLKLIDANGKLAGQLDRQPVLDAYPTSAWRNNEYIADAYDVPIFVGATPGEYILQVTMYDPATGQVFGQRELARVQVAAQTQNVPRELLGVSETVLRDLGGVELSGYDLDVSEPYATGADVPLTLLWRVRQDGITREYDVTVTDEFGKIVQTQSGSVGGGDVLAGQYVRQELGIKLPANLTAGKYSVSVTARGGLTLPFSSNTVSLGRIEVVAP